MAIANFQRVESKYRLDAEQLAFMRSALEGHMSVDAYGATPIVSRYYDTAGYDLIERSLEKPLYKEKLRLRSYGRPRANTRVFVEVKKKFKGVVYKRRVSMTYIAAQAFLQGADYRASCLRWPLPDAEQQAESLSPNALQISREIASFLKRYEGLAPSMETSCVRTAYAPVQPVCDDTPEDLRITFDTSLASRDLTVKPSALRPIIGADEAIMEIKTAAALPLWLVDALDEAKAYPSSFSKYGTAYQQLMREKMASTSARFACLSGRQHIGLAG